jgi:hypothetical protein
MTKQLQNSKLFDFVWIIRLLEIGIYLGFGICDLKLRS